MDLEKDTRTHCVLPPAVQHSRDGAIWQQTVAQSNAVESARMVQLDPQAGEVGARGAPSRHR